MDVASVVINHISDKKSELSLSLESTPTITRLEHPPFTWKSWFIPRICTVTYISLLVYWIITEQNGFTNSIPSMIKPSTDITAYGYLGYHALGLSIWAVIVNQETIMSYSIPLLPSASYQTRKNIHIGAQIIGVLSGIGGMVAIIWYKNSNVSMSISGTDFTIPIINTKFYVPYSPHAWLGIAFMGGWVIQCIGRLFPERFTLAYHRFCGRLLYVSGLLCCCLGIQQQQTRQLVNNINSLLVNSSSINVQSIVESSSSWFSQPSLLVLCLGIAGAATFFYGLL